MIGFHMLRQLGVDRGEILLVVGHVVFCENRLDRTLRDTERAIDALVGIDDQEIRPLAKAIDRAHIDAIGVLAADAGSR